MGEIVDFEKRDSKQLQAVRYWRERSRRLTHELSQWREMAGACQSALAEVIASGADAKSIERATEILIAQGVRK